MYRTESCTTGVCPWVTGYLVFAGNGADATTARDIVTVIVWQAPGTASLPVLVRADGNACSRGCPSRHGDGSLLWDFVAIFMLEPMSAPNERLSMQLTKLSSIPGPRMAPSPSASLIFSKHAIQRLQERHLSPAEVGDLWDQGRFVACFFQETEQHYVAFIPHLREYCLLVCSHGHVVTIMPLIWRESTVAASLKIEAYERAVASERGGSGQDDCPSTGNDAREQVPMVKAKAMNDDTKTWVTVGRWPRTTAREMILHGIAEILSNSGQPVSTIVLYHGRRCVEAIKATELPFSAPPTTVISIGHQFQVPGAA